MEPDEAAAPVDETYRRVYDWLVATMVELGLPVDAPDDDFFVGGGTSLTAIRLISRAEAEWGEEALLAEDLYERSSVAAIATTVAAHIRRDAD
jgi:hypothetical protein